ncbi:MAG: DNA cytosine methyltransferase [Candidatus Kapabacteria bacterium]|nr:DNA cytosine methyltransferase [Candidatus Kapabacteria bacterium]
MMIYHLDLCSGIGTFAESAQRNIRNYELEALCESDEYCQEQLRYNFNAPIEPDVRTIDLLRYAHVNLITAGFPCQDISIANNNAKGIHGENSGLWFDIAKIITYIRPRYVVLENSSMLVQRGLTSILVHLASIGYALEWRTLRAEQFGYPHRRKRLFVFCANTDGIGLEEIHFFHRTITEELCKTEDEAHSRLAGKFSGLAGVGFFRDDYPKFCEVDNGYTHQENAAELHALGNSIIPECCDVYMRAINTIEGVM